MATYAEQLANVQAAIAAIETGAQSYSVGGRSKQAADLAVLYKREAYLRVMVDRDADGGIGVRAATPVDI